MVAQGCCCFFIKMQGVTDSAGEETGNLWLGLQSKEETRDLK